MKATVDLNKALAAKPNAKAQWESITPIARRDFVTWIQSAKQEETRVRRIGKACDMLAKGKRRPCCYAAVPMNLYKALDAVPKAKTQWKSLTPIDRRDIVAWIDSGKDADARAVKIDKAIAALAAGKRTVIK